MASRVLVLVLLLLVTCDAGEDGADAGGDAGDGTEGQSSVVSLPGQGDDCRCTDSDTWVASSGMGPCASYAIGEVNEGYCDDDGATAHCPKACDACPLCVEPAREVNGWLVLMGIMCMSVCFGVPTAKYVVDIARMSANHYRRWKVAQDEKMKSLHTKNTVRKAKNQFLAMGAAGKLKGLSVAAKFRKAKVAPGPADMRTEQEEAELAQLSEQITRDQETLQRFSDEGNGDSKPYFTLRSQVDSAVARQAELQSKRPFDRELIQRMERVRQQREAAEAAAAAASVAHEAMAQEEVAQGLDLERQLPLSAELEPVPEPEPQPLAPPAQAGGMLPPLQGSPASLPRIRGAESGMRIGGLRGDGHSHVFDRAEGGL